MNRTAGASRPNTNKFHLTTIEEEVVWKQCMIAYISQGGSLEKGAHLKFSDRAIIALRMRNRQEPEGMAVKLLHYCPSYLNPQEFCSIVQKAVQTAVRKIPAINDVRTQTGCGLKEAKEAVELYAQDRPNPAWNY